MHPFLSGRVRLMVLVGWWMVKSVDMLSKATSGLAFFCAIFNGALVDEKH